jgi:hypothetical protein
MIASPFLLAWALAALQDSAPENADNVRFVRPQGWVRRDGPEGVLLYPPDRPPNRQYGIALLKGQEFKGAFADWFEARWKELAARYRFPDAETRTMRYNDVEFLYRETRVQTPAGTLTHVLFIAAPAGSRAESFLLTAEDAADWVDALTALDALLKSVEFVNLAKPPPAAPPPPLPEIEAAFWGLTPAGTMRFLVLFKDGTAWRDWRPEGLDGWDLAKAKREDTVGNFGRWKRTGDSFEVSWTPDFQTVYVPNEKKTLYTGGGAVFRPMIPADGLKLEGTFERDVSPFPPVRIRFKRDGTFADEGAIPTVASILQEPPARGQGRYEIRHFSLILTYEGGKKVRTCFWISPEEAREPRTLFIGSYVLERR